MDSFISEIQCEEADPSIFGIVPEDAEKELQEWIDEQNEKRPLPTE